MSDNTNALWISVMLALGIGCHQETYKSMRKYYPVVFGDSIYYKFHSSGRIKSFHSLYENDIRTVTELNKKGRLVAEFVYIKDTLFSETFYHQDKLNSIKSVYKYKDGKRDGFSFSYFKRTGLEQDSQIMSSKFFYRSGKVDGYGYHFYKSGKISAKHYYDKGEFAFVCTYNKRGKSSGCVMSDSVSKAWGYNK